MSESSVPGYIMEFPSPTDKQELTRQIEELSKLLASPPEDCPRNMARIKLADLYVGRNEPGDYMKADKAYSEVLSASLPRDREHAYALIGKAELSMAGSDPARVKASIDACRSAVAALSNDKSDFFWGKGSVLLAELLIKAGTDSSRREGLDIYESLTSSTAAPRYFRMRAVVGKIELINYFFKELLEAKAEQSIDECQEALDFLKDERPNDYFYLKGLIVLSEVLLWKDKKSMSAKAGKLLTEVVNSEAAGDDLRARASLDLAEISSPPLARSLIKGVRRMEGIDPYLLNKAKAIEGALKDRPQA